MFFQFSSNMRALALSGAFILGAIIAFAYPTTTHAAACPEGYDPNETISALTYQSFSVSLNSAQTQLTISSIVDPENYCDVAEAHRSQAQITHLYLQGSVVLDSVAHTPPFSGGAFPPPYPRSATFDISSLSNGTYTARSTGTGYNTGDTQQQTFTISNRAPTVDLRGRVAGSGSYGNGPIALPSTGGSIDLQWTTTNSPTSCSASASPTVLGWSGSKVVGGGTTLNIANGTTASRTYTITCSNANGSANDSVTVTVATVGQYTLAINKAGTGSGTVTSNPTGINCNAACPSASAAFNSGASVVLTATPASGSTFVGWTGTGCTTGTVSMTQNRTCTATFNVTGGTNPTASLSATPATVAYGQSSTLAWSSTNSTACYSTTQSQNQSPGFFTGTQPSGSVSIGPFTVNRTYGVDCGVPPQTGSWVNASANVNVTPECLPAGQTVQVGQQATLTARGGNGTYAWTSTGGTPASGAGSSFNVSYATAGTKSVTVTSASMTSTACTVTVTAAPPTTGAIVVSSNVATTWAFTGPSNITQNTPTTSGTYSSVPTGSYTISPGAVSGYTLESVTPATSQNVTAGNTTTWTLTYVEDAPSGEASVDIKADGSDNPPPIAIGATVDLSWTSNEVVSGTCVASGGWSGSKADSGTEESGSLSSDTTFTITCEDDKGVEVQDLVSIIVQAPQCSDGLDNDGDEIIDYSGGDPGCYGPEDDSEADQPQEPGEPVITECNDGFDNDGDGEIDYGADDGCSSEADESERYEPDIEEI